jgi:hypothetical protein
MHLTLWKIIHHGSERDGSNVAGCLYVNFSVEAGSLKNRSRLVFYGFVRLAYSLAIRKPLFEDHEKLEDPCLGIIPWSDWRTQRKL